MDLTRLTYFRTLGRVQHVTRAAEQLGISQPTLSRAIARLEAEVGKPLFYRVGRSVGLSPFGTTFLPFVERALDELGQGQARLTELGSVDQGTIALGFLRTLQPHFVPNLVRRFRVENPTLRFILADDSREHLWEKLHAGQFALCITERTDDARVEWRAIANQVLTVIVSPDHRFASRSSITLDELAGEPLVAFKEGFGLRKEIDALLGAAGVVPNIVSESDGAASVRALVAAGSGVAIVPNSGAKGDVVTLAIDDQLAVRDIGIAWVSGRYLSDADLAFRKFVIDHAENVGSRPQPRVATIH